MAKAPKREAKMTNPPKAPASETTPEPSAFERMRELTRRLVQVPKAELPAPEPKRRREKR